MGNLYTNRKYLVTAVRAEEDGTLLTPFGELPVFKNNLILHDDYGNPFILDEQRFNDYYVPVKKVEKKKVKPSKSPFEQAYLDEVAKAYSQDWVTGNTDETYIALPEKMRSNKAF